MLGAVVPLQVHPGTHRQALRGTISYEPPSHLADGGDSVTFTVTNLVGTLTYDAANHDPDGDSNGTSITVTKI